MTLVRHGTRKGKRQIRAGVRKKKNVSTRIMLEDISGDTRRTMHVTLPTGASPEHVTRKTNPPKGGGSNRQSEGLLVMGAKSGMWLQGTKFAHSQKCLGSTDQ